MNRESSVVEPQREHRLRVLRDDQHRTTKRTEIVVFLRRIRYISTNLLHQFVGEHIVFSTRGEVDDGFQSRTVAFAPQREGLLEA